MGKTINKRRKLKKTRKQRKYYGGESNVGESNVGESESNVGERVSNSNNVSDFNNKDGVIDMLKNRLSGFASASGNFLKDKSLRLFGLQPVKSNVVNAQNQQIEQTLDNVGSAASNIISDVESVGANLVNVANKGSAAVLENFNEVLGSKQVNETISEAAHNTAKILENQLQTFNKAFENPQFKQIAKQSLDNAAEYAEIAVDAMNKPINKAIDELNQAGEKAFSGVVSGSIKVGTDALAAVPGAGAIVETGKIINDASKAVSSVVEAGSEAVSTASDLFTETSKNIKHGLEELEEKKRDAINIANRTSESINQFENPMASQIKNLSSKVQTPLKMTGGGKRKTYKNNKYNKNNKKYRDKSKRVRFAL